MTVHSAKGLEFHAVFVTGLEEGLFPHENSLTEADGLEEERRLMYVAITRARQRLYLSFAQTRMLHGQTRYNIASRFFDEIPRELVQWLSARVRHGAFAPIGRRATRRHGRNRAASSPAGRARRRRHPRGASARASGMRSSAWASSSTPKARQRRARAGQFPRRRRQVARARSTRSSKRRSRCKSRPRGSCRASPTLTFYAASSARASRRRGTVPVADVVGDVQRRDEKDQIGKDDHRAPTVALSGGGTISASAVVTEPSAQTRRA